TCRWQGVTRSFCARSARAVTWRSPADWPPILACAVHWNRRSPKRSLPCACVLTPTRFTLERSGPHFGVRTAIVYWRGAPRWWREARSRKQDWICVSTLRAVPALDGVREHRLWVAAAAEVHPSCRSADSQQGERIAPTDSVGLVGQSLSEPIIRRPAAARGTGARPGGGAARPAAGRTIRGVGRQGSQGTARLAATVA